MNQLVKFALLCGVGVVPATLLHAAAPDARPAYSLAEVDQRHWPVHADIMPTDPVEREKWAAAIAYDAAIYGTAPVIQYRQMYAQAVDRAGAGYTGFNAFQHDRDLAKPGYKPFRTPNADTLYSNAWLDLTRGPVLLTVPDMKDTYFTVNFLDIYANASNISARTRGFKPGKYLIVPAGWQGSVPAGVEKFTLATPFSWILMRILVANPSDLSAGRQFQAGFQLEPQLPDAPSEFPAPDIETAAGFFHILDWTLRANGYPVEESALVARYRAIGVGGGDLSIDQALADPAIAKGMETGLNAARKLIASARLLSGYSAGAWKMPADTGAWGYNYLYRAVISTMGTGANVMQENYPFNTFQDADGDALDGKHHYKLRLAPPPPARFFWSVTMYDATNGELVPNPIGRHVIGDRTQGLVRDADGGVTLHMQATAPASGKANWLPTPTGPFYLVIRAQGPEQSLLDGQWQPQAVEKVSTP